MAPEQQQPTVYAYYLVVRRTPGWAELGVTPRRQALQEAGELLGMDPGAESGEAITSRGPVRVRGVYSVAGLRADADLMWWWVSPSVEAIQELFTRWRRTRLGSLVEVSRCFVGLHRPAEFNPEHVPAFVRGEPARRYLCVYPFVRTPEWYLLEPRERARHLREHGELAQPYPDVLANTTAAFGLGDYEWILAFEADALDRLVDLIRALRAAQARRFVKEEIPFITGVRKSLEAACRDLE